ncbi:MAG: Gfo/Idh/MocA family oxidoreductase [Armatimonadetes bacterium]|nr:Gfo/Idh/MocA family oxidoreductase [Armatimonadota bacterium]MCA1996986.1 Gfo/Idh/MocA family oxidoreductase [Armatimonadota bacterium]
MAESKLSAGIIGYGGAFHMGKAHAESLKKAGIETVAVCDLDPARLEAAKREIPGVRTYRDYRELLADPEVGLVINILPHNLHASICVEASKAGKHVVTEKPMCITVEEADAMIDAARQAGKMLSVFHNRRWDDDYLTIRETVASGLIGDVFHVECFIGGFHGPRGWWRDDKAISGGALYDWGAHFLDWILNLMPAPVANVTGFFHKRRWTEMTNEDQTQAILRFEDGAMADLQVSNLAAAGKPKWRILGTQGAIVVNWGQPLDVTVEHKGHMAKIQVPLKPGSWQAYYDNVAEHLLRGGELEVKPEQSRRTIAMIVAAEESSKTGQAVVPKYR